MKKDGRFVVSAGRAKLLRLIHEYGSISKAAEEMGMSYRHAWGSIRKIEEALGEKVVISERGGQEGGSTRLTPEGRSLLIKYENTVRAIDQQISKVYLNPLLATDGIVLIDDELVLVRRGREPFKGSYALPGGFVEYGETVESCVVRELEEETGLKTRIVNLLGVYSDPERDPRGHVISLVFHLLPVSGELRSGDDAAEVRTFRMDDLPPLAFDHERIVRDFVRSLG